MRVRILPDGGLVAAIADGLGGHLGGEVASKMAAEGFMNINSQGIDSLIKNAMSIHEEIVSAQKADSSKHGMASTLTGCLISPAGIVGAHTGDTRVSLLRGRGIKRLTEDHTEVQRLLRAGKLTKTEAASYPRRHILESALGAEELPRIDAITHDLFPGDRLIMTTDGVHEKIRLRELYEISHACSTPHDLTIKINEEIALRGPTDNYSLICIDVI